MRILAGTSGWSFKEWKGTFYPKDLPDDGMLSFYAGRFPTVEINNTFYRMPKESVLLDWASKVPPSFRFAIKASQRITHHGRLKDVADETLDTLGRFYTTLMTGLIAQWNFDPERAPDAGALTEGLCRVIEAATRK